MMLKLDTEARVGAFQIRKAEAHGVCMRRPGGLKVFATAEKTGMLVASALIQKCSFRGCAVLRWHFPPGWELLEVKSVFWLISILPALAHSAQQIPN